MAIRFERILLTGSRGFTGRYLRGELEARGHTVIGLVNEATPSSDECAGDLTDVASLQQAVQESRPDAVVHLGGIAFVAHQDAGALYATNALGTLNLLETLVAASVTPRRVVLASSANVYGDPGRAAAAETAPTRPLSHYGASKLAMEAIVHVYRDRLACTVTRPFNYTGPGQAEHFLVPKIVAHFARRAPRIELGNLDIERDFLDVRAVSSLYADLVQCEAVDADVINLCSGQASSLREIVARLTRITGHEMELVTNPAFVRGNDIQRLVGDNARLRQVLGKSPEMMDLDTTLRDMLDQAGQGPMK